MKLMHLDQ